MAADMEARAHAILGASGSKKWLTCTPSARLEETFPNETSAFASEGTKCHDLMEIAARKWYFKEEPADASLATREGREAAGFTLEMEDVVKEFMAEACKITDPLEASGKPYVVLVEQRLDYSDWVPEGFGTGDLVVVAGNCIWVRDLKYGKGIPVDSDANTQMMLYGLGAYNELCMAYDGTTELDLGIIQPRIHNNSSWRATLSNLLAWGELIKPIAQLAWEGKGDFVPGDHCKDGFCRARFTCKARASACLAASASLTSPNCLMDDEIDALLPQLGAVIDWAQGLQEYAAKQAIENGVRYPSFKVVEGRSNRYIGEPVLAQQRLLANGFKGYMTEPKLVGITELEKITGGKAPFTKLLGDIVKKPTGKPTLVPLSDKRPELAQSADDDFAD